MINEFIAYLNEQASNGSIYVWGAQGQMNITEAWIRGRETSTANANRAIKLWKARRDKHPNLRAFDCSGLGMYWLQNVKGLYKADMSANGMMGQCDIVTQPKRGDWVFRVYRTGSDKGKAYHIGYVVDDALNVVEAKGRDDGVVMRKLNASGSSYWNKYGRPRIFGQQEGGESMLRKGDKGEHVKLWQLALIKAGQKLPKYGADSDYGSETEAATKAFQAAMGLRADGIAGMDTMAAMWGVDCGAELDSVKKALANEKAKTVAAIKILQG